MRYVIKLLTVGVLLSAVAGCGGGADGVGSGAGGSANGDSSTGGAAGSSDSNNVAAEQYSYIAEDVTTQQAHTLLLQSTFGPTDALIAEVQDKGIVEWVNSQLEARSAYDSDKDAHQSYLERSIAIGKMASPNQWSYSIAEYVNPDNEISFNRDVGARKVLHYHISTWFENALNAEDQLRQRVAYALSQILVVSDSEELFLKRGEAFSYYYDILARHAFGNYRDLLLEVSMSPAMGIYLTHQGNKKFDADTNRQPDENYARELMQLFSIGLSELDYDGMPKLDEQGRTIPTYTQQDVEELSRVLTGWDLALNRRYGDRGTSRGSYTQPMEFTEEHHDDGAKVLLGQHIAAGNSGREDLQAAIDILMQHDNIAPFISKQLIMRLVTSNPTPEYVGRVSAVFNDNGNGVKGDLKTVVRAILLDREARVADEQSETFSKFKEPLMAYIQLLRAFEVDYIEPWDSGAIGGEDGTTMKDVYLFKRSLKNDFGQAPMRAKNVFNFYSPNFVPNDDYFKDLALVAPELEIQSAQRITNYSNRIGYDIGKYEKLRVEYRGGYHAFYDRFIISFIPESDIVVQALNNDFDNIQVEEYKTVAVDQLLAHLNRKMTNSNLTGEQLDIIKNYLMGVTYGKSQEGVREMIADSVKAIATSNSYMVQR